LISYTFLGDTGKDVGNDIAFSSTGNVIVVGETSSSTFPLRPEVGAIDSTFAGGEAIVAMFDPCLSADGASTTLPCDTTPPIAFTPIFRYATLELIGIINETDAGLSQLKVIVNHNENMHPGLQHNTTLTFTPDLVASGDLVPVKTPLKWSPFGHTVIEYFFNIVDNDLPLTSVSVTSRDGVDVSGVVQVVTSPAGAFQMDTLGPTPTITSTETAATNSDPVTYAVTFSEAIDAAEFDTGDISASSGTVQNILNTDAGANLAFSFEVATPDEGTLAVSIPAGGLVDLASNVNLVSNTFELDIDNTPPSVTTTISDDDFLLTEANVTGTFRVNATFNDIMNVTDPGQTVPVVTFTGPDIGSTLTFNGILSGWISSTEYEAVFDVADDNIMVTGVVAKFSGAEDDAGNGQNVDALGVTFAVDTAMPGVETPAVTSITTNATRLNVSGLITDLDAGGHFRVSVLYNETMDATGANDPLIALSPDIVAAGTLIFSSDAWFTTTLTNDNFTRFYTIADVGKNVNDVDITVTGARDSPALNLQIEDGITNRYLSFLQRRKQIC